MLHAVLHALWAAIMNQRQNYSRKRQRQKNNVPSKTITNRVFGGFRSGFVRDLVLLGHNDTSVGNRFPTFRQDVVKSSSRVSEMEFIYRVIHKSLRTYTAERSISIGRESLKVFFGTRGLGVLAGSTARG